HQLGIYAQGMFAGTKPSWTTNLARLEEYARDKLSPEAFGYIVPSAGDSATTRANRAAFERYRIVPRMLRSRADRSYATTVLGTEMPAPVMLAPLGVQNLAHPDAELATVRAAAGLGVPYVHSTQASRSFEEVAEAGGNAPRWYQLYWPTDDELCLSFLRRAKDNGFSVLVLTLDTLLLGYRPADLDRGYLPFLAGGGIANYVTDPVFRSKLPKPPEEDMTTAARQFAQVLPNPGLGRPRADARGGAGAGMDGSGVSNHGGRQRAGAVASRDAPGRVVEAGGDELTVRVDSGTRTGGAVLQALARRAEAVRLGRPCAYGR